MRKDDWKYLKDMKFGVTQSKETTKFLIWAPSLETLDVYIYKESQSVRRKKYAMTKGDYGLWSLDIKDVQGHFYTYLVDGTYEIIDPYVESCNGNSTKGSFLRAADVNPQGFLDHERPKPVDKTKMVLYEIHVKDFSSGDDLPFAHKGKYLAFTEGGLTYGGEKIGIDHLVDLGVTHVHLLPVYDFITVNDYEEKAYNWGYDPYLFNAPEGSYATDPDDPRVRIIELKSLIMALHAAGIGVILDVVYNHTYFSKTSNFQRLMPDVFYRKHGHEFSNGSGCGNELQTEHVFVEKFIIDSLLMWLEDYRVDGFRFDLMGLYDLGFVTKMNTILKKAYPHLVLYGEPWTGGLSSLASEEQFLKGRQRDMGIAFFNDDFRNAIKGSNDGTDTGFAGAGQYRKDDIFAGCFGSIDFSKEIRGFALRPSETINYVSSHDNLILMDKVDKAFHGLTFEERQNINALALSLVFLSFGIPFIQGGTEFLRSKYGDHNSYKSPYYVNRLHWENKGHHKHVFDYVKTLIKFRKSQKFFGVDDGQAIREMVRIVSSQEGVVAYEIHSPFAEDHKGLVFVFNGTGSQVVLDFDKKILIDGSLYYTKACRLIDKTLFLPPYGSVVLKDV